MTNLGFEYYVNKRSYYIDGHDQEDVVKDRNDRFLIESFKYELLSYRWIQLTNEKAIEIENELLDFQKQMLLYL